MKSSILFHWALPATHMYNTYISYAFTSSTTNTVAVSIAVIYWEDKEGERYMIVSIQMIHSFIFLSFYISVRYTIYHHCFYMSYFIHMYTYSFPYQLHDCACLGTIVCITSIALTWMHI